MTQLSSVVVKELISIFKKTNVVQFGSFQLKDGSLSKVYFDLRVLSNYPKEFKKTIKIIADYIKINADIGPFDGIIAPPLAGIPLGVALALELDKEYYLARLQPKAYGTKKFIEGNISKKRILIVDDVITTGGSKIPLLKAIRDNEGRVESLFVVVNRTPDAVKLAEFEQQNQVKVHYLLSLEDLI